MSKLVKVVVIIVVAIVLIAAFVLFHHFDSPGLGQKITAALKDATGIELSAGEFSLQIAHGLTLKNVRLTTTTPGGRIAVKADEVLFKYQLGPLLHGDVVVDRVLFDRPVLTITSAKATETAEPEPPPATKSHATKTPARAATPPAPSPAAAPPAPSSGKTIRLSVQDISITDATIELLTEGDTKPDARITGASLALRDIAIDPSATVKILGLAGQGQLSFAAFTAPDVTITDGTGTFGVSEGHVTIRDLGAKSKLGSAAIDSIDMDATARPFDYKMAAHADAIDLNLALGVNGKALGPAKVRVNLNGAGSSSTALTGTAQLTLAAGSLPDLKALQMLDRILKTTIVDTKYEASDFTVTLAKNVMQVKPFQITSGRLRLGVAGAIDLNGPLNLQLSVSTPRADVQLDREVSNQVLDALTDPSGWLTVPVDLTGTMDNPDFSPDRDAIKDLVAKATRTVAKATVEKVAGEQLDKLIKKVRR